MITDRRNLLKGLFGLFATPRSIISNISNSNILPGQFISSKLIQGELVAMKGATISIDPDIIRRAINTTMIQNGLKVNVDIFDMEYTQDYLEVKETNFLEQQYEYRM